MTGETPIESAVPDGALQPFLQQVFACSSAVAATIALRAKERRYPPEAVILKQGDHADTTYLIITGRADALIYGPEGQLVLLREYGRGDFFGAVGDLEPESADIVTVEELSAAVFRVLDFLGLAERHSCVGLALSRALLRQLRSTSTKMAERSLLSAAGRIHAELRRLARLGDGRTIRPVPVLADLAVRVHSTRETVSRTISGLERRGIIRREPDALLIVAPHRLDELVI